MTFRSFCNVTNSLMNYFLFFKPKLFVLFLSLFSFLRFFCAHISTLHLFNSVTQSLSYLVSEMDVSLWDLYIITVVHSPSNLHTFIFNVIFLICQKVQETILHQIQLKHHGAGFTEFIAFIYIYIGMYRTVLCFQKWSLPLRENSSWLYNWTVYQHKWPWYHLIDVPYIVPVSKQ